MATVRGKRIGARQERTVEPPWLLRHSLIVVLAGIAVTAAVAGVGVFHAPYWEQFAAPPDSAADIVLETRQAVRDQAIRLATGLGAITAGLLAWSRLELSRQEHDLGQQAQFTDRYTKAIGLLGQPSEDVKLGGLYALERLGQDSPRDRSTITEVLSAYVREHTADREEGAKLDVTVQAALTILGRTTWQPADLTGANLTGANLTGAIVYGADLTNANLTGAIVLATISPT